MPKRTAEEAGLNEQSENQQPPTKQSKQNEEINSKKEDTSTPKTLKQCIELDFTPTEYDQYPPMFQKLANFLINSVSMVIDGDRHRFMELEFYVITESDQHHRDEFTHGDEMQLNHATWYFHRQGNGYKSGSYKGLDLTVGDDNTTKAGILIRSLQRLHDEKLIEGPSLVADHVLRSGGKTVVQDYVDQVLNRKFHAILKSEEEDNEDLKKQRPHLIYDDAHFRKQKIQDTLFSCPRVGITLKQLKAKKSLPFYLFRHYRFMPQPKLIKKGKHYTVLSAIRQERLNRGDDSDNLKNDGKEPNWSFETIQGEVGSTVRSIKKYAIDYITGYCHHNHQDDKIVEKSIANDPYIKSFASKSMKTSDICILYGYLDRRGYIP